MKYYLHSTDSFDDEKITELFMEYGYEGLGLFYTILEKLGKQEKPVKTSVLKKQLKVGKRLEKCWNFMESLDIISSNNGETFNKQLLNFSEKYKIKSEKNSKRISEWREKQAVTENVTRYEQKCNSPKVKESKVNRSKVNILYENYVFFDADFGLVWDEFLGMRIKIRKPATVGAEKLLLQKIEKLRGQNFNPIELVEQSIRNSWQDIFPIKNQQNNNHVNPEQKGKMQRQFEAHEQSLILVQEMFKNNPI